MPVWIGYTTDTPYSMEFFDTIQMNKSETSEMDAFLLDVNLKELKH